jgi:hypothetical protein
MVKTVSELESRVMNYHGKTEKQKDGSACMYACVRLEGDGGGRWARRCLVGCEVDGDGHVAGWLAGLTRASNNYWKLLEAQDS